MIQLKINGLNVSVEEGTTLLEAAKFIGFPIPTLCHMEGCLLMEPAGFVLWRSARARAASSWLPAPILRKKASRCAPPRHVCCRRAR